MSDDKADLTTSLIGLIRNKAAGSELVALAAEAIAADARFNHRVARTKYDTHVRDDEFFELLDLTEALFQRLQTAIREFDVDADQKKLGHVLGDIRSQLDEAAR
jgi:hypothetical protein